MNAGTSVIDSMRGATDPIRLATEAMGTRFEAVLFGDDRPRLRGAGEAALDIVHEWDRRLSWFSPGSFLSHINARAAESPVRIDRELYELLSLCRGVWERSGGAFDVTIAPLMVAWGLRGGSVGSGPEIECARRLVGMHHVVLDPPPAPGEPDPVARARRSHNAPSPVPVQSWSVAFSRSGISIDLGSIAKGAALDAAAAVLRQCGVGSALLHGGTSSVVAIGAPPGLNAWTVAIETGRGDRPVVRLRDTCLSVSAPRGRSVMTDRGPAGHIIDPRTGEPARRVGTAAAIHPCGALCDAWSTALLVLGDRPDSLPEDMTTLIDPPPYRENAA